LTVTDGGSVTGPFTFNNLLIASGGLTIFGNTSFEGGLTVQGALKGNTTNPPIVTGSVELDWNVENFFSIELAETASTFINVVNINEAQTVYLRVRTQPGATASFSENVWQKSGSLYTPTNGNSIDIIKFVSFDTEYAYLSSVTNYSGSYSNITTTTTTAAPSYEFNGGYAPGVAENACNNSGETVYSDDAVLTTGSYLATGPGLVSPVDDGYYAFAGSWYLVSGSAGIIDSIGSCPSTTTTTTVIPYEYTPVGFNSTDSGSACADSSSGFWSPCSSITIGCRLSPGSGLVAAMDNGFYSLSGSWFEVTGGDGVISASGSCA
jgi:hypothetical protein